jgi:MarR family transcriptional regulator, lower aerobic nicotinate degradation pathway regulator
VAAEPLAERLVAQLEVGEPERLTELLTRFAHPPSGEA